jgi:surface antigen
MTRSRRSAFAAVLTAAISLAFAATAGQPRQAEPDATLRSLAHQRGGLTTGSVRRGSLVKNLGTAVGAWMQLELGARLAPSDREFHDKAARDALWFGPTGSSVQWMNYRSKNAGAVTARAPAMRAPDGSVCRLFEDTITLKDGGGVTRSARVCLGPDRVWRID